MGTGDFKGRLLKARYAWVPRCYTKTKRDGTVRFLYCGRFFKEASLPSLSEADVTDKRFKWFKSMARRV
jgi:hypothetical protein